MGRCHRSLSHPHDPDLSRLLVVYVVTGLAFMLLPGTFVGLTMLLKISAAHGASAADAGWVQAHGHAQVFGWLGTFILGIGYYTIPRLRLSEFHRCAAWTTYGLWVAGVGVRWGVGSWPWHWRVLFPAAGVLELAAVVIFAVSVFLSRPRRRDDAWRASITMITAAGWAMVIAVAVHALESIKVALTGSEPVFPAAFNQRFLALITWGFIVPFIWGFSSRWFPPLLGLRKTRTGLLIPALAVLFAGLFNPILLLVAVAAFVIAIRLFEPARKDAFFIRLAYVWSGVAAALVIAVPRVPGAARHALTVGFFAATVFAVGPRILPAFFNARRLWSPRLMTASLTLLNIGCTLRVVSQTVAYQQLSAAAWKVLPVSAAIEMTAVTLFAANLLMTLTTGSPLEAALREAES